LLLYGPELFRRLSSGHCCIQPDSADHPSFERVHIQVAYQNGSVVPNSRFGALDGPRQHVAFLSLTIMIPV
jgi:hypothetical protein